MFRLLLTTEKKQRQPQILQLATRRQATGNPQIFSTCCPFQGFRGSPRCLEVCASGTLIPVSSCASSLETYLCTVEVLTVGSASLPMVTSGYSSGPVPNYTHSSDLPSKRERYAGDGRGRELKRHTLPSLSTTTNARGRSLPHFSFGYKYINWQYCLRNNLF